MKRLSPSQQESINLIVTRADACIPSLNYESIALSGRVLEAPDLYPLEKKFNQLHNFDQHQQRKHLRRVWETLCAMPRDFVEILAAMYGNRRLSDRFDLWPETAPIARLTIAARKTPSGEVALKGDARKAFVEAVKQEAELLLQASTQCYLVTWKAFKEPKVRPSESLSEKVIGSWR